MILFSVLGNSQKLDGGAMYGNAPKALWTRWTPADEFNRIDLSCRCLLLKSGTRTILFETGIGSFFPPQLRERYGVQEKNHVLLQSLSEIGSSHEMVTDVVLSHLHFDHAGGLLEEFAEGKPPRLLFPNAKFYVGEKALQRAKNPHFRDKASFIPQLTNLLEESGRLEVVSHPDHHGLSPLVHFRFSDGHTPGLTLSQIQGPQKTIIFVSDLIPGAPWVHLPITMGYDRYPEKLIDEKESLLKECEEKGYFLFFTHDPNCAISQVKKDENGKFCVKNPLKNYHGEEI